MDDKVRELERQLQAARNEVKRYASFALRAQQELACERRQRAEARRVDAADDSVDLEGGSLCDYSHDDSDSSGDERPGDRSSERVERALDAHDVWARKITRLTKSGRPHARKDSKPAGASNQLGDGSDLSDSDAQPEAVPVRERGPRLGLGDNGLSLHDLKAFLRDQRLCIADLARENARLRDMLRSRPTRQELLGCRLEIERLQAQVHRLRTLDGDKVAADASRDQRIKLFLPVEERAASASRSALSDRIMDDKLLRLLHVQVESIAYQSGGSSQQRGRAAADASLLRRSFLQENVFCRLSLDPSALSSVASTENSCGAAEQHDDILRRIGRVSSEIVASCCYVLDVEDVAKLPQHVEALQRLAQIAPVYQAFTEKLEQQLQRFDLMEAGAARRRSRKLALGQQRKLNELLEKVKDALVELDARRQQMKPPGSKAHDVLFESMQLLRVTHIDEVAPNIRRMLTSIRAEQMFKRDLRELLGLDDSATRQETLGLVSKFFCELGLASNDANLQRTSATTRSGARPRHSGR